MNSISCFMLFVFFPLLINGIVFPDETDDPKQKNQAKPTNEIPKTPTVVKTPPSRHGFIPNFKGCPAHSIASKDILNKISSIISSNDIDDNANVCQFITKGLRGNWICFSDLGGGAHSLTATPNTYICFTMKNRYYNVVNIDCVAKDVVIERPKYEDNDFQYGDEPQQEQDKGKYTNKKPTKEKEEEPYDDRDYVNIFDDNEFEKPEQVATTSKPEAARFDYQKFKAEQTRQETADDAFCVRHDGACVGKHGTLGNCCKSDKTYCHKNDPTWAEGRCYHTHQGRTSSAQQEPESFAEEKKKKPKKSKLWRYWDKTKKFFS